MDIDMVTAVEVADYVLFALILLVFVGSRFNQWPSFRKNLLSGLPRDYIDRGRYRLFYLLYIGTFVLLSFALLNAPMLLPLGSMSQILSDDVIQFLTRLQAGDMGFEWTAAIMIIAVLLRRKSVEAYDEQWRDQVLKWARIPKTVEELKNRISRSDFSLHVSGKRLARISNKLTGSGVGDFWAGRIDNWQDEQRQNSTAWRYLKACYLYYGLRDARGDQLNSEDARRYEVRLGELGSLIALAKDDEQPIGNGQQPMTKYAAELDDMADCLIEQICKSVVQVQGSEQGRYNALKEFGLNLTFTDTPDVKYLEAVLACVGSIFVVCLVAISGYLLMLDAVGVRSPGSALQWFEAERLGRWTAGNLVSYSMAIFVAMMVEQVSSARQAIPGISAYTTALVLAVLCAFVYFIVAGGFNYMANLLLAISLGAISVVVVRALSKESCSSKSAVFRSACFHGLVFGGFIGLIQMGIGAAYRGGFVSPPEVAVNLNLLAFLYGFVKGAGVGLSVSYVIQESIRRQLLAAQRHYPRARFRSRLQGDFAGQTQPLLTRNVSQSGLMVETMSPLQPGDQFGLCFSFGVVPATVRWANQRFAGLEFDTRAPHIEHLRHFIRQRFGSQFA